MTCIGSMSSMIFMGPLTLTNSSAGSARFAQSRIARMPLHMTRTVIGRIEAEQNAAKIQRMVRYFQTRAPIYMDSVAGIVTPNRSEVIITPIGDAPFSGEAISMPSAVGAEIMADPEVFGVEAMIDPLDGVQEMVDPKAPHESEPMYADSAAIPQSVLDEFPHGEWRSHFRDFLKKGLWEEASAALRFAANNNGALHGEMLRIVTKKIGEMPDSLVREAAKSSRTIGQADRLFGELIERGAWRDILRVMNHARDNWRQGSVDRLNGSISDKVDKIPADVIKEAAIASTSVEQIQILLRELVRREEWDYANDVLEHVGKQLNSDEMNKVLQPIVDDRTQVSFHILEWAAEKTTSENQLRSLFKEFLRWNEAGVLLSYFGENPSSFPLQRRNVLARAVLNKKGVPEDVVGLAIRLDASSNLTAALFKKLLVNGAWDEAYDAIDYFKSKDEPDQERDDKIAEAISRNALPVRHNVITNAFLKLDLSRKSAILLFNMLLKRRAWDEIDDIIDHIRDEKGLRARAQWVEILFTCIDDIPSRFIVPIVEMTDSTHVIATSIVKLWERRQISKVRDIIRIKSRSHTILRHAILSEVRSQIDGTSNSEARIRNLNEMLDELIQF